MRLLTHLRHTYKLANLTYPHKNFLSYVSFGIDGGKSTLKRYFASNTLGGELGSDDGFQEAFAVLSLIRDNSLQFELHTESLEKFKIKSKNDGGKENTREKSSIIIASEVEGAEKNTSNGIRSFKNPSNRLPICSMNKEMTNLAKVLFKPSNLLKSGNLKKSNLSLSANTRLDPYDTTTIPLHLNTLINGSDTDSKKIPKYHLKSLKIPEFNEYLTSMAAILCSAAFQSGFSSGRCRKYYSTENTVHSTSISKKNEKVKKIEPSSEVIIQDLMKKYDEFQNGIKSTVPGKYTNDNNRKNGLGLLDPQLYKKSLKEAENKRKEFLKASASCKEKLSIRACQSKKSKAKDKCKSTSSKCESGVKSVKHFESLTEPSSPFKCCSKTPNLNYGFEKVATENIPGGGLSNVSSESKQTCGSLKVETKSQSNDPCQMPQSTRKKDQASPPTFEEKPISCRSENPAQKNPCGALPKICSKHNKVCRKKPISKCTSESKVDSSKESCSNKKTQAKKLSKPETNSIKCEKDEKVTEALKYNLTSERKNETTSKSESMLEDPSKSPPTVSKSKSCGSLSVKEDPCKVPPITFEKTLEKSASASKCSAPCASMPKKPTSAFKCEASKEEKTSSCGSISNKSASASNCSSKTETSKIPCKTSSEATASKCSSKCSFKSSCVKSQTESLDADSEKACKRVGMDLEKSCDSETKNPCKSSCDSMTKPKAKCGRPPRGDTRPKCKKDSKLRSTKPSPCASKKQSVSKCGTENKQSNAEPSKCGSKTCSPSPKSSKTEIKPKSTSCTNAKTTPSLEPSKRKLHSLSNFSRISNLIFSRSFSDDCPEKPKGEYKLESERSDEYRRETCENFSWKASKSRKKRNNKPKNCYPEETQEFCPNTACYKVYAETSGKADRKKGKKKPKVNKMKNQALCLKNPFDHHQKRHLSSNANGENEEALIQKPHSICTRRLTLPEISENDALICIDSVALSDTDIYMFETGGRHTPTLTLGNEASGIVTEVGKSICNLKPGDHVVLESGIPCFKCDLCKIGRYNLCNNISFKGFLKNKCIHPASFCHKICQPVPLEHAALIPQLAVGFNTCSQAAIKPNSNVAILGSCAKAVCAAISAVSMGAENICVMCEMPETRILIEQFVTEKVYCFDCNTTEKGIVRTILASLGTFPDIVINCCASTKTMNAAVIALKPAGVCIVAGFLSECVSFNIMDALMKEIRIVPSFRSKNMFPKAIHLLESGRAPLDCLIANCELCKWNELEGAFKLALSEGNNGPRKAIVKCQLSE